MYLYYLIHQATAFGARCQSAKTYLERKIVNFSESDLNGLIYHAIKALKTTIPNDGEYLNNYTY